MVGDICDNRAYMMFWKEIMESGGQEAIAEVEEENRRYEEDRKAY